MKNKTVFIRGSLNSTSQRTESRMRDKIDKSVLIIQHSKKIFTTRIFESTLNVYYYEFIHFFVHNSEYNTLWSFTLYINVVSYGYYSSRHPSRVLYWNLIEKWIINLWYWRKQTGQILYKNINYLNLYKFYFRLY